MALLDIYDNTTARLRASGEYVWPMALRMIMFWEFWESGVMKYKGKNWFADIPWADWQQGFPWPFTLISAELNWFLATWGELLLSVMIQFCGTWTEAGPSGSASGSRHGTRGFHGSGSGKLDQRWRQAGKIFPAFR